MMKRSQHTQFWLLILGLGIFWRIWHFGSIPTSLNRDEAALGYNAFAITTAGIDEWGHRTPLIFRSFGDFKLPGYIYVDSVLVRILGNSDVAVRLPSLLAGLGIIGLTYAFGLKITRDRNKAILLAALTAIEPWSIFYSRMGYESHLGLFLLLLSLYWLIQTKRRYIGLGVVTYAASVMTYNTPLLLAPVILIGLWFFADNKRRWLAIGGVVAVALGGWLLLRPLTAQKQNITIFSDPTIAAAQRTAYVEAANIGEKIWNQRYVYWGRTMGSRLAASLSPQFLVLYGGQNPWHNAPDTGHVLSGIYWLFWIGGLTLVLKAKNKRRWVVILLILGCLLPAVVTVDAPHATRSLAFFFGMTLLAGYGLWQLPSLGQIVVGIFLVMESGLWAYHYFVIFPNIMSNAWPVGLEAALQQVIRNNGQTQIAIVAADNADLTYDQIYIFPLYYLQIDPRVYISTRYLLGNDAAGLSRVGSFKGVSISGYNQEKNALMIERQRNRRYVLE